jgi:tetratricopeptide (TPR) repeat protein
VTPKVERALLDMTRPMVAKYLEAEEFPQVVHLFDAVAKWVPGMWKDPVVLKGVAKSYEELGFLDLSTSFYRRARDLATDGASKWEVTLGLMRVAPEVKLAEEAISRLADIQARPGFVKMAEGLLTWAISENNIDAVAKVGRWLTEAQRGRLSPQSIIAIGHWHMGRGAYQECADLMREAVIGWVPQTGKVSLHPEAWVILGDALRHLGKPREALGCYTQLLNEEPWGFPHKLAAYRAVQLGRETGMSDSTSPYLTRLLNEPVGSIWRPLANSLLKDRQTAAEES